MTKTLQEGMSRSDDACLSPKDFVYTENALSIINMRQRALTFLFWAYGCTIAASFLIFLLQGFKLFGFNLDLAILKWLGGATVGEIAGLAVISYKGLFNINK